MSVTKETTPYHPGTEQSASIEKRQTSSRKNKSLSMHEGVPIWYDCCSCEAEPYWLESVDNNRTSDL